MLGLEIGADDYLCKPFSMRELMARVKVALARQRHGRRGALDRGSAGRLRPVDDRSAAARGGMGRPYRGADGHEILLQGLVRRPGIVKTREQLMIDAYPDRVSVSDRTIEATSSASGGSSRSWIRRSIRSRASTAPATAIACPDDAGLVADPTRLWRPSRIGRRLLAFNLLLVFFRSPEFSISTSTRPACSTCKNVAWCSRAVSSPRRLATGTAYCRTRRKRCCRDSVGAVTRGSVSTTRRRAAGRLGAGAGPRCSRAAL